ncbi:Transcriptional regulator, AraC family [Azotobacter vinelandii CA]|uniref:Transcriptional regulator, AraC family n=2 Tax=Azotobacter vinelandii TaxID=354 RepID=C1DJG3_AZOVD|nr:AraC family transcriptional regulator [Azotobacter vinelandii]ACO76748.1 Transcriptional regulator, AraC family [Azotobacter vinelandii DJ]AGK17279.1 Transcriptional regulator, AraC family [Azotobacter vinelandii CA]AGK19338.1 Transcriptional regulator, AraC family [Azotobacter vinelandii CA6]SFX81307.1 AraC-type DNA-binding protein [Azotobacter vinelandii]GLK60011.1 AraC family transcriptional regulator [Azotobacter vinelandii]
MSAREPWYERDSRFIAAHQQPAGLLDLGLGRGIDSHRLLRGSGLFHEDILRGATLISPEQYLRLIDNAQRLLAADDTSFLFGQRLLPGHQGAASQALAQAGNLLEALRLLGELRALLCPLLSPRLVCDERYAYLYWLDSCGAGPSLRFLLEAHMAAATALGRRLSGERLPWRFHFRHAEPRCVEQYWVHLGEDLHFGSPCDLMRLPLDCLNRPLPQAAPTAGAVSRRQARAQLESAGPAASLLDRLYDWLLAHVREAPGLERAAEAFAMSPTTFKRKLRKHATSYQEQHDRARLHVALWLQQVKGYGNEAIASYLHFHDANNFRRSFKRWTGMPPSSLRQSLCG